ncbi:metallophosphoesterase family protein [Oligoflexus tunisiensis]|uniref:metallophosphoesterase family protein n=1 Tax=Oligoflexus tunisiensis TaxID=708132 RepID=UPI000A5EA24F|nr:metallophosphoesterase [Oligoflexus tunisiensis]
MNARDKVRLGAVADIHCTKNSQNMLRPLFEKMSEEVDILLLCGDLTDYGRPEEAHVLAGELTAVDKPILAVLGNHDYESGHEAEVTEILRTAGVNVLDGDVCEIDGIGFVGVKGFGGGFGRAALEPWGEKAIKRFVQESINEALKLESALARLNTAHTVVLLHYSPIEATIEGETPTLYPYLGSSRLEEPLARYPVTAIFHGHAHKGSPQGYTRNEVPVYNVAMPLLKRLFEGQAPFRILELSLTRHARTSYEQPSEGQI